MFKSISKSHPSPQAENVFYIVATVRMLPISNSSAQSAYAKVSAYAKASSDKTADKTVDKTAANKLAIGNIGTGNIPTLATFND